MSMILEIQSVLNLMLDAMGDMIKPITYVVKNTAGRSAQASALPSQDITTPTTGTHSVRANPGDVEISRDVVEGKMQVVRTRNCVLWQALITFIPKTFDQVVITENGETRTWIVTNAKTDQANGTWLLELRNT